MHATAFHDEFSTDEADHDLTDAADSTAQDALRALVFDLPARPGTLR